MQGVWRMYQDSFYLPVFWLFVLLCSVSFSNQVDMGGIAILLPGNLPSVSPLGCSQSEPSWARNLWGSGPCNRGQSRGRERKRPEDWCTLLGCVPTGIVFREYWSSLGHISAVRWWNGGCLVDWMFWRGEWTVTPQMGCWQHPLHLLTRYKYPLGRQPLSGSSIISLTLNEPVRSLSEQGFNGVGKKSEKLFVPWEVEEHEQKL